MLKILVSENVLVGQEWIRNKICVYVKQDICIFFSTQFNHLFSCILSIITPRNNILYDNKLLRQLAAETYLKQILSASDFFYTLKAESDISIMLQFIQNAMDFSIICLRRIKSHTCRKHFQVLFSFFTYHRVCNQSNTTGATSGAGTAYPSGTPSFLVRFVLLDLQFSVQCFVDGCLPFFF